MTAMFLSFVLFLLPLIVLPFGTSHFETPKVILFELPIQFLLCYMLFNSKAKLSSIKIFWPIFAIIFLSFVRLIFHEDMISFFGNPFRLQGVFFLWNMLAFVFIVGISGSKKYPSLYPIITLIALTVSASLYGRNASGRFIGALGEPNAYAAASLFIFSLVFFGEKRQAVRVIACLMMIAVLLLSQSRSAMVGFAVEMLFYLLLRYKVVNFSRAVYASLTVLLAASFLPVLDSVRTFENRLEIWLTALYAGSKYPLVGWGIGRAEEGMKWGGIALENNVRYQYIDSAHNILLDWWVIGGALGVLLMCVVVYRTIRIFVKKKDITQMAAFMGVLATLWFNPGSVYTHIAFWYLVGIGFWKQSTYKEVLG